MDGVTSSDPSRSIARVQLDLEAAPKIRSAVAALLHRALANELLDECRGQRAQLGMLRDHRDQGTAIAVDHEVATFLLDLDHAPDLIDDLADGLDPRSPVKV